MMSKIDATTLIGDKNDFAVEYRLIGTNQICFQFWISKLNVGTLKDEVQFGTIVSESHRLVDWPKISTLSNNQQLLNGEIPFIKNYVFSEDKIPGARLGFPENFDDFLFECVRLETSYIFVWQLAKDPYFTYEDYPRGIQIAVIREEHVNKVMEDFLKSTRSQ